MFIFDAFMVRAVLIVALIGLPWPGRSQYWFTKANLTDSLEFFTSGGKKPCCAWVDIHTALYRGDVVTISSNTPLYVFAEGRLMADGTIDLRWPVDSLRSLFGQDRVRLILYEPSGILKNLSVIVETPLLVPAGAATEYARASNTSAYPDFILSAVAGVVVLLLMMFRTNRHLAMSYFNAASLLSYRESEDHPVYNRVTNTTNILLIAVVVIIFSILLASGKEGGKSFSGLWGSAISSAGAIALWIVSKGIMVWVMSALFAIGHLKGLQYMGFVRYMLWIGLLLLITELFDAVVFGSSLASMLAARKFLWWSGIAWGVLVWRKLRFHTRFSAIHLFSYLCATEAVPLLLATATNWKA
ncbi:MAG: hypothetical protein KatS3mg032_2070 [Cyclobacteriaceae bacterium]|nr:MAG: hypothetical protein KatS3mg032_2070 [Cyclobacteriaceae bacterium]